jgi:hypothetical protein
MINNNIRMELQEDKDKYFYYDITDKLKTMMGNFVQYAEISIMENYYSEYDNNYFHNDLEEKEKLEKIINEIENQGDINFDGETITITFINGNKIEINSSEWGSIRKT